LFEKKITFFFDVHKLNIY